WFVGPRAKLTYQGRVIDVRTRAVGGWLGWLAALRGRGHYAAARLTWDRPETTSDAAAFWCEIVGNPRGRLRKKLRWNFRDGQETHTESWAFDSALKVFTNRPSDARRLLGDVVQKKLLDLCWEVGGAGDCYASFGPNGLIIAKRGAITSGKQLHHFVQAVIEIHSLTNRWRAEALDVEFVEEPEPNEQAELPLCGVCGDPVEESEEVRCRGCDAPHHRECWEYNGLCSIYACGERDFHTP
ncbi:MAG: hypothetical protein N2C14_14125, partial [Planctomycetales bacterium]